MLCKNHKKKKNRLMIKQIAIRFEKVGILILNAHNIIDVIVIKISKIAKKMLLIMAI